jgi:hypothetical protein
LKKLEIVEVEVGELLILEVEEGELWWVGGLNFEFYVQSFQIDLEILLK